MVNKIHKKYILLIITILLFIIATILVITNKTSKFDSVIYNFIISFRCQSLDNIFKTITKLGNTIPVLLIIIACIILIRKNYIILLVYNSFISLIINTILKNIIERPRPNILRLIKQGGYSYPSGHAMISICLYATLIYLVQIKIKDKKIKLFLTILLTLLILLIGVSRIYLGVHYPSDILGGYLLSLIILITNISLFNKFIKEKN